ncbi:integral membrane protein, YkoY family [Chitinophaga costaii]|uniref:Integral membrane protein, YkoY family n=1 Tax=Chitinophaga costaii TaxID=1335309 RepID=A0A1C4AQ06_9BACT|nr:DUF475 domain-containing protein [Chitinophaga costaii]PUZ26699.1 DUF475 domain-containing protein [Chitinophaga costaii]SCB96685.1 integral membrane protein, YkoY family [Chitinophaga costaii]
MYELLKQILDNPLPSLAIVGNLILIESLLSVDNAAVLATMVMDLPGEERKRALRYGILGAYVFRGLALVFASFLLGFWWLKPLGGLYLLYLVYKWWKDKHADNDGADETLDKKQNWLYRSTVGALGNFWATVALVELMDMAFSIDNVFAAVAFSKNILLILTGVFIGILAMRFVAQGFVKLMEKYTFLETCAFIVIAILGIKLGLSVYTHFYPCAGFSIFMEGHDACLEASGGVPPEGHHETVYGDVITTILTLAIFFVPIITSTLFNFPKKHTVSSTEE